jgi:hypothetical protein
MNAATRTDGDAMTNAKTTLFLGLCSLGLATLGCRDAQHTEGTIEFVVRSIEEVGGAVPRGSFEVRGLDNDEHARVGIGSSAARTLSLRLPAGAYSVAWLPSSSADSRRSAAASEPGASEWPQVVVVSPEASATVDVFVAAQSTRGALAIARTTTL